MTLTLLDINYFKWLTSQIETPRDKEFYQLFELMHNLEYIWTVPNDDNRVQDGMEVRVEFMLGKTDTLHLDAVTFLEVLIGLSRRVAFTAGGKPDQWAWRLIKNLELNKMSDNITQSDAERITDILSAVVWRTYQEDGKGGFFPLQNPTEDQTKVEVWYQMNAYVNERTND